MKVELAKSQIEHLVRCLGVYEHEAGIDRSEEQLHRATIEVLQRAWVVTSPSGAVPRVTEEDT